VLMSNAARPSSHSTRGVDQTIDPLLTQGAKQKKRRAEREGGGGGAAVPSNVEKKTILLTNDFSGHEIVTILTTQGLFFSK